MLKSLFQTSIVSYIVLALTMLGSILIARHYGPSGQGELAALILIPQMIINFGDFGTSESIMYHLSNKKQSFILSRNTIFKVFAAVVGFMLLLFSIYLFFFSYSKTSFIALLGFFYIVLLFVNQTLSFIVRGHLKLKTYNFGLLILNVLNFASIVLVIALSLSIENIFAFYLFSCMISSLYLLFKISKFEKGDCCNEYTVKDIFSYGIKVYAYKVLNSAESQFDKFMIATFLLSSQLGLYSVAVALSSLLYLFLVKPVASIILPILNRIENIDERQKLITLINKLIFWAGILFGILLLFFSKQVLIYIYGEDYLPALIPLWILLLGVILKSPMSILAYYFKSIGTPEVMVKISIVTVALNVLAGLVFIPKYGIMAAAVISTVTYTIYSLVLSRKYIVETGKGYLNQYLFSKYELSLIVNYIENLRFNKKQR